MGNPIGNMTMTAQAVLMLFKNWGNFSNLLKPKIVQEIQV